VELDGVALDLPEGGSEAALDLSLEDLSDLDLDSTRDVELGLDSAQDQSHLDLDLSLDMDAIGREVELGDGALELELIDEGELDSRRGDVGADASSEMLAFEALEGRYLIFRTLLLAVGEERAEEEEILRGSLEHLAEGRFVLEEQDLRGQPLLRVEELQFFLPVEPRYQFELEWEVEEGCLERRFQRGEVRAEGLWAEEDWSYLGCREELFLRFRVEWLPL